jgi:hypothetical protein
MAGQNFKRLTRSPWAMWCTMGKFSNFENFVANSKIFENFATYSIFLKKFPANSKILMGNLSIVHHFCVPVAHWVVRYG